MFLGGAGHRLAVSAIAVVGAPSLSFGDSTSARFAKTPGVDRTITGLVGLDRRTAKSLAIADFSDCRLGSRPTLFCEGEQR